MKADAKEPDAPSAKRRPAPGSASRCSGQSRGSAFHPLREVGEPLAARAGVEVLVLAKSPKSAPSSVPGASTMTVMPPTTKPTMTIARLHIGGGWFTSAESRRASRTTR